MVSADRTAKPCKAWRALQGPRLTAALSERAAKRRNSSRCSRYVHDLIEAPEL
jgi:hypothetical protein